MDDENFDVAVIGAGIIGASCAFSLARRGLRVVVLEQASGPADGSTGLSFASVRAQWNDPINIELAWRSICSYRDFESEHGIDVGYRPTGYLFLFPSVAWERQQAAVDLQREYGVPVDVLDVSAAQAITEFDPSPAFSRVDGPDAAHVTEIVGATFGPADGQVDPHGATTAFLELARRDGASVRFRFPVRSIEQANDDSWLLSSGARTVRAQSVVNAAGGWSGHVAALAGLDVPVTHSRRNVYVTAPVLRAQVPLTVDVCTGAVIRSEGARLLCAVANPDEPEGHNLKVDWQWMETVMEHCATRFPWVLDLPLDRSASWAGTYEVTPDHTGIVGPYPGQPTWINACGFSGHGVMQAPEVGRIVAEQVAAGDINRLDVSSLAIERFRTPAPATASGTEHPATRLALTF